MSAAYEKDVVLWAKEQARALRERDYAKLDIERLADEAAFPETCLWDLNETLGADF